MYVDTIRTVVGFMVTFSSHLKFSHFHHFLVPSIYKFGPILHDPISAKYENLLRYSFTDYLYLSFQKNY